MRTKLIIILVVAVAAVIAALFLSDFLQQKTVTFTLRDQGYSVEIGNTTSTITSFDSSSAVRLKPGSYYYAVVGENFSTQRTPFTVTEDETITVQPVYSDSYLANLSSEASAEIITLITTSYPQIAGRFITDEPKLLMKGDWAAGKLTQDVDPRQSPDVYRYIVQKVNGSWRIVAEPELTISKYTHPNIPLTVIRAANQS